jgi:hypothetical protein
MNMSIARKATNTSSPKKTDTGNNNHRRNKSDREAIKFIQEYEELLPGHPRKKAPYKEPKTIGEYASHLQGPSQNKFGGHRTQKICGLKGNTYGPAGPCRSLAGEELAKVEADLRAKGTLKAKEDGSKD